MVAEYDVACRPREGGIARHRQLRRRRLNDTEELGIIRSTKRVLSLFEIRSESLIGEWANAQSMLSNSRVRKLGG